MTRGTSLTPLLAVVAAASLPIAAAAGDDIESSVRAALTDQARFTAAELADLQRGSVVKHSIDTGGPGEIAVTGAVRIDAEKAVFLDRIRDIVRFKRGPNVVEIGRFGEPPAVGDMAGLSVGVDDFDVRRCRVADCGIRLPAGVISRLQHDVDANAPDAQERGAALFKRALVDHVVAYRSGGDARMLQYDDGDRPIRPVDEFNGMLDRSPFRALLPAGAFDRLRSLGTGAMTGADDFLYWSKEQFGVGPFISVTHVTLTCLSPQTCLVITRDVYSSRFLDASLAVAIASDSLAKPNSFYLMYANESRANALKGRLSGLRKVVASRRARQSLEESLKAIKQQLEQR